MKETRKQGESLRVLYRILCWHIFSSLYSSNHRRSRLSVPSQLPAMFERSTVLTTTRRMPFPARAILEIIHSPSDIIRLNPNVVAASPSPTDPSQWNIESRVSVFGGWMAWNTQYTAKFDETVDGAVFKVTAGAGITTLATWTCKEVDGLTGGGESSDTRWTDVTETAELRAPAYLMSFVASTRNKSHQTLMEFIERRLK